MLIYDPISRTLKSHANILMAENEALRNKIMVLEVQVETLKGLMDLLKCTHIEPSDNIRKISWI